MLFIVESAIFRKNCKIIYLFFLEIYIILYLIMKMPTKQAQDVGGYGDVPVNILKKPLFGFGVDGILNQLNETCGFERTHNEFLQYASFFGISAGIMYICGVFSVFLKGLKHKNELDCYTTAGLVTAFAYLVSSFFGNSFFYTVLFLFIFLGLGFVPPKHK